MIAADESAGDPADHDHDHDHRDCRGAPLLLVFGKEAAPGGPPEHADLFGRIARRRPRPTGLIVLQDRARSGFYRGAAWFGTTIDEVAAALQTLIAELAPSEVVACGTGTGGHAALVFGVLLGASRIVAIEPPAHLIADELAQFNDRRWSAELAALPDPDLARRFDVSALLADRATGFRGRAFVLLGTRRGNDHHDAVHQNAIHAHRLARSDRVTLCPFPEFEADVLGGLVRRGDARDVLSRYLFEPQPEGLPADSPRPVTLDPDRLKLATKRYQKFKHRVCVAEAEEGDPEGGVASYAAAGEFDAKAAMATRVVDDGWREWIAGNLLLDASPGNLEETLVRHGISEQEATREVWQALQSPYLWGALRLHNRLKKRDWLLAVYRKLRRLDPEAARVERRHQLPADEFLAYYHSANRPVILTGLIDDWPAVSTWSLDAFSRRLGDRVVEAQLHPAGDPGHEHAAHAMTIAALVERLRRAETEHEVEHVTLSASAEDGPGNAAVWSELRDDAGPIPGYLDGPGDRDGEGTFRLASAGSATPFRFNRESLLVAQVLGETGFTLAPSWDLPVFDPARPIIPEPDGQGVPAAHLDQPQVLECLLGPGEVLILPVGWWSLAEASGTSATLSFRRLAVANDFAASCPDD